MDPRENEQPESLNRPALPPDERRLESTLRQFAPRPLELDRERLMFLAGQASVATVATPRAPSVAWFWPASTVAMSGVAACLAVVLSLQSAHESVDRIVYVPQPAPTMEAKVSVVSLPRSPAEQQPAITQRQASPLLSTLPAESVLQMRNVALRWGVDALPGTVTAAPSPSTQPNSVDLWHQLREPHAVANPHDPSL